MIGNGVEPSKILVGLPAFGKKFRLTSDLHDLGSPATFVGSVPYTEVRFFVIKYRKIDEILFSCVEI